MLQPCGPRLPHSLQMIRLTRRQRRNLWRIVIAAVLWLILEICHLPGLWGLFYVLPYLLAGYDVLWNALRNILHGQVFDENFLMCVASIGAFFCGEYPEGVMVMVLYQVGELFQSVAVGRSRDAISSMMDLCPDEARVVRNGQTEVVDPTEVEVGETVELRPGERIPLDGRVISGESAMDASPLTGESVPRPIGPGESVFGGCVNLSGVVQVEVLKPADESSAARILEMMESATEKKARTEQFITRFARVYTPLVCALALVLAVVPSILTGNIREWVYRAMTFLVISCPCALVISVPLTFFGGIGKASRSGILVKSGADLEKLAKTSVMVFDKTGTLTEGKFTVTGMEAVSGSREELLEKAAFAESASSHPIARSILEAFGEPVDESRITARREQAGHGVSARIDGTEVLAGSRKYLLSHGVTGVPEQGAGTTVFVAENGKYAGAIYCADEPKAEAREALEALSRGGVRRLCMLTGDDETVARKTAGSLGLTEVHGNLLPEDKIRWVEQLLQEKTEGFLAFVGDGINDAPVLRRSDLGIAMGAMGSDAAIEAADVVLMDDNLQNLPRALSVARSTMAIARQNIVFALGVKILVLLLGALGIANMWMAVFADVGVAMICILNACRLMFRKRDRK